DRASGSPSDIPRRRAERTFSGEPTGACREAEIRPPSEPASDNRWQCRPAHQPSEDLLAGRRLQQGGLDPILSRSFQLHTSALERPAAVPPSPPQWYPRQKFLSERR